VKHHALEEVDKSVVLLSCDRPWVAGGGPKGRLVWREPIVLKLDRLPLGILAHEDEVAEVRDKHLAVRFPILRNLGTVSL